MRHREKWRLALDMLDEMHDEWGVGKRPVAIDSGYGDAAEFRCGLDERGYDYIAQVDPTATAHARDAAPEVKPYHGKGRPPVPAYPHRPATLREHALAAGQQACREITWRHGSNPSPDNPDAAMRSQFLALRIRPANRKIARGTDGSLPECWMIADWPPETAEPVKYWLSNMDHDTPLETLVRLAKIRWRVEHDYRELKHALGMDHFEGRSFTGWHRHITLVVLAQAFCTLLRLDPKAPTPA